MILEKKYPFIKVVKNRIYTLAYPVFIKIKACKAIFQRINNTSSNKNYETSKFFESTDPVQFSKQIKITTSSGVKVTFFGNSRETSISP